MAEVGTAHAGDDEGKSQLDLEREEIDRQRAEFEAEQKGEKQQGEQPKDETDEQKKERESKEAETAEKEAEEHFKKLPPKSQDRINAKIGRHVAESKAEREARHKAELEAAELRGKLAAYEKAGMKPGKDTREPDPDAPPPKPQQEDFDTHDEWMDALLAWNRDVTLREVSAAARKNDSVKTEQDRFASTVAKIDTDGKRDYQDFESVTHRSDVKLSPAMVQGIIAAGEEAHHVQYALMKDPAKVERLAQLPPAAQLVALGEMKASVALARKATTTKAPPPVTSGAPKMPPTEKSIFDMNDDELSKEMRRRQMANR